MIFFSWYLKHGITSRNIDVIKLTILHRSSEVCYIVFKKVINWKKLFPKSPTPSENNTGVAKLYFIIVLYLNLNLL